MKNIIPFLRYIVDPRKVKTIVLVVQCFALSVLVGCRAQAHKDQVMYETKYETQIAELIEHYETELAAVVNKAEAGIYVSSRLPVEHEDEATVLAKLLYGYRNNSAEDLSLACWCVFNRVENPRYPSTVEAVVTQPQQWMGFSEDNPVLEDLYVLAHHELSRWYGQDVRPMSNEYLYMTWSPDEIVLRDSFEETKRTHYWRA